jgi:hypothetical protein
MDLNTRASAKIYLGGNAYPRSYTLESWDIILDRFGYCLQSYVNNGIYQDAGRRHEKIMVRAKEKGNVKLFLDSGAFSAFSQGVEIKIDEYIKFIKEHIDYLEVYANLDVIGDPAATLQNQRIMERAGLKPLPCFHYGEPISYLIDYIDNYDYIALGGMVPISTQDLIPWLDDLFHKYICGPDGLPKVKVHGFGLTSFPLMKRYPWFSVDSTSWVMTGRMGSVYVPRMRAGKWIYTEDAWKVAVSTRSPSKKEAGQHVATFSPGERVVIEQYFKSKGYKLGKSEFKMETDKYALADDERWNGKALADGRREVEIIIEAGLCNDYMMRDELNIIYFLDLEASMPAWPWAFKLCNTKKGFGL